MSQQCLCTGLPIETHIPMGCDGLDELFFATVDRIKDHGGKQWWLYSAKCSVCAQDWLVAQEERIFDEYFLIKISPGDAESIVHDGKWPNEFQTYEEVLIRGSKASLHCEFFDDMAGSLIWSVQDLLMDRPEISVDEIATLLGIAFDRAERVLKEARQQQVTPPC